MFDKSLLSNIVEKSLKINFIPLNETVYALLTQTGKWHHTTTLFLHANWTLYDYLLIRKNIILPSTIG